MGGPQYMPALDRPPAAGSSPTREIVYPRISGVSAGRIPLNGAYVVHEGLMCPLKLRNPGEPSGDERGDGDDRGPTGQQLHVLVELASYTEKFVSRIAVIRSRTESVHCPVVGRSRRARRGGCPTSRQPPAVAIVVHGLDDLTHGRVARQSHQGLAQPPGLTNVDATLGVRVEG